MVFVTTCPACGKNSWQKHLACLDYTVSHETFEITVCAECSLLSTNPRPDNQNISRYYQSTDYISHTDKASSLIDKIYLITRKFTLRWKQNLILNYTHTPGKLLDYGCGTGDFLTYCKERNWLTTGVEPASSARTIAAAKSGSTVSPDLNQLPAAEYDVITLWHVLEHIPSPNELLMNLQSLLAKDGILFIAVPNYKSYDGEYYNSTWAGYDVPRHLWHFNKDSMQKLLSENKLHLLKVHPMKLDSFYVSLLSEKYIHNGKATIRSYIKAFAIGLRSNLRARKTGNFSSLIYVVKKAHD